MKLRRLMEGDLRWLMAQPGQSRLAAALDARQIEVICAAKHSHTILRDDGLILACGGLVDYWDGRSEAWICLNTNARASFIGVHKVVKRYLKECGVRRIEASVAIGFDRGHRWVKALGFEMEAPLLKAYLPGGVDSALYARVN